jgi:pimeloyl-ACP methyl ester carboxylesterase
MTGPGGFAHYAGPVAGGDAGPPAHGRRAALITAIFAALVTVAAAGCTAAQSQQGSSGGPGHTAAPAGHQAAPDAAAVERLGWHACRSGLSGLQCTSIQVPLNYQDPQGRKITLALSRAPATAPASQYQGVMLVNPGGPGGSGLSLASDVESGLKKTVASDYDIVGFDPRGVGSSVPALHCDPSFFSGVRPDYIPAGASAEQALETRAKAYAGDCGQRFGWLLPYMTSADTARDMDSIRAALGQRQITYFGDSYGTYLGELYGTLFPSHLRRMVLDSTVDPEGVWYQDNIDQDYAFQKRMQAFFGWVAANNGSYGLGSSAAAVQQLWYRVRSYLGQHPVTGQNGRPTLGPDEIDDTFLQGGYDDELWPDLASALAQFAHAPAKTRDQAGTELVSQYELYGTQNENQFAVYNAVQCSDVNWPRNWSKWDSDTRAVYRTAPFQAWDNAWFNAACAFWPVRGASAPMQIKGQGLPGVLMLQSTGDAATPYDGAQVAHRLLPSARMVVVSGGGNHVQSLQDPPNTCVDGYLNKYLGTGALPQGPGLVNATCPAPLAPSSAAG